MRTKTKYKHSNKSLFCLASECNRLNYVLQPNESNLRFTHQFAFALFSVATFVYSPMALLSLFKYQNCLFNLIFKLNNSHIVKLFQFQIIPLSYIQINSFPIPHSLLP